MKLTYFVLSLFFLSTSAFAEEGAVAGNVLTKMFPAHIAIRGASSGDHGVIDDPIGLNGLSNAQIASGYGDGAQLLINAAILFRDLESNAPQFFDEKTHRTYKHLRQMDEFMAFDLYMDSTPINGGVALRYRFVMKDNVYHHYRSSHPSDTLSTDPIEKVAQKLSTFLAVIDDELGISVLYKLEAAAKEIAQ